jgi:hypothetical protein
VKPWIHAENSAKKFGGKPSDYLAVHDFFDSSKAHLPDMRHRAVLHSSFGIFIAERLFGTWLANHDGVKVQVRDVGEQHVLEDLGVIPTLQDYLEGLAIEPWMGGPTRIVRKISMVD